MSQPTVLIGKYRKKKEQNFIVPPYNAFWSQPPTPVRSLTEVPLDMNPSTSVQPSNIPSKPPVVELVHDKTPNTPSTSNTTNATPITAAKTPISATNSVMKVAPRMMKKQVPIYADWNTRLMVRYEEILARKRAINAKRIQKILAKRAALTAANASGNTINKTNITGNAGIEPNITGNAPNESNITSNASKESNVTGNDTSEPNADQIKVLSKWQRRKQRRRAKKELKKKLLTIGKMKPDSADPPKTEETKPSTPVNETPPGSKDPKAAAEGIKGFTIPKLMATTKPTIVLNTKKNLQKEMSNQQITFMKPDSGDTGKEPETLPGNEVPNTAPKPTNIPGGFTYKSIQYMSYPKGIPRSFLKNQQSSVGQQMTQIPGNQQNTPVPGQQLITSDSPIWPNINVNMPNYQATSTATGENMNSASSPIFVQTENQPDVQQPYSPSDIYTEPNPDPVEELESPETPQNQSAQKRLSAFQRLGPVSEPKKTKLTINLTLNKEQPVREVINDTDDDPDRYTPGHLRKNIISSTDETVVKYLPSWPWKKNFGIRRSVTARHSRSVMILEQEQMEEAYEKDNLFFQISVKGYPSTWTKERVLDAILESVRGYGLIPCFIEFYQHECKFLTLRSRSALITLHKTGFYIHKDGVELTITITQTNLSLSQIEFIPRIVLRKRVGMGYADKKLNLSAFTLQEDISHFIYYPLNNLTNQSEFVKLKSVIAWDQLTDLDLSHNRLTIISGFELNEVTPRLKHLNLSHNLLEKITVLLGLRGLLLKSLCLEGNPLCNDYIDPDHYIKVVRMMFPTVAEIDGIPIHRNGELAHFKQNYCTDDAKEVAEKFLEIYFPLLDSGPEHRSLIQGMYEDDAMLTITYCYTLRYGPIYRCFRNLFLYARFLDEGETDSVVGAMAITKLINRWPQTEHDPFTFTVDVMYHTETTTILRIGGILKLTAETLAEDEHLLSFTRTVVLYSEDGDEYKIHNEMVYWDEPSAAGARSAFRVNTISQKKINLKIESTTDEDLREKYLKIFMKLTTMDKKISKRCLEINDWNFKQALEHFTKLLKLNNLQSLFMGTPTS